MSAEPDLETGSRLLLWGFQGTVDYRARLTEREFAILGFEAPDEDREVFVSRQAMTEMRARVEDLEIEVETRAGGGPLLSALAAHSWCGAADVLRSRFVGALPLAVHDLLAPDEQKVVTTGFPTCAIAGSLCLEYPEAATKLVLSVTAGRWLDRELAQVGIDCMRSALSKCKPARVGLGIGGLNKATPSVVLELMRTVRRRLRGGIVFASGSSFAAAPTAERPLAYWNDLSHVFSGAEVVSVSGEERDHLARVWGEDWPEQILTYGRTQLVITHSPRNVIAEPGPRLAEHLEDVGYVLNSARLEACRHASDGLTGLGAHFDGVLSAAVLAEWRDGPER